MPATKKACSKCTKLIWDLPNSTGLCKRCWSFGRKHTTETKLKLKELAEKRWQSSDERQKQSERQKKRFSKLDSATKGFLGKKHSEHTKKLFSSQRKGKLLGSNNPSWNGGTTTTAQKFRSSKAYKRWRKAVFERDNYTCVLCRVRGGELNADHVMPYRLYPQLGLDLDNGRTLCKECHKLTDSYGWKGRAK